MTPSILARIDSMIHALSDVVVPSIDSSMSLAREQAQLVVAHLHLVRKQLDYADEFDRIEQSSAIEYAHSLLALTSGDPGLAEPRKTLQQALDTPSGQSRRQDAIRSINGTAENFVRAVRLDGSRTSIDAVTRATLRHAQSQSRRNRIWFGSNGFDADSSTLPSIESLFQTGT